MQLTQQRLDEIFAAHQSGNFELLLKLSKQFQQDFPTNLLGYKAEGVALLSLGKISEALKVMKQAVKIDPYDDEAISNLGQTLLQNGKIDEAIDEFEKATKVNPFSSIIFSNLANAYKISNKAENAKNAIIQAMALQKLRPKLNNQIENIFNAIFDIFFSETDKQNAYINIQNIANDSQFLCRILQYEAFLLHKNNEIFAAIQKYQEILKIEPESAVALNNLSMAFNQIGDTELAILPMRKAMKLEPNNLNIQARPLVILPYLYGINQGKIGREAKIFAKKVARQYPQKFFHEKSKKIFGNLVKKNQNSNQKITLKIGLVSGDLRDHAVAKFLLNLFDALQQRQRLQINSINLQFYAYPTNKREDNISQKIKKFCQQWTPIDEMSDEVAAEKINNDGIQILFDLSGLTENHRLFMFALKPAPIQISWIGWLGTTGIPTMDYFLADEFCVPFGEKYEQQFSEKVLRMPNIWEVLTPPNTENFSPPPKKNNSRFIFASFNNPNKVNSKTLDLWCEVLKKSPENTQFIWLRGNLAEVALQEKFLEEFAKRGVNKNQILLKNYENYQNYLQQICEVDLILDSVQFSGMTTTAEALSLGTPTITLLGDLMPSRLSGSCINSIGDKNLNKNFIFDSETDFVNQAVFFANNPQKLNELKNGLAEKARKSPLCDAELFAKNFEIKMQEVWDKFLNS